LFQFAGLANGDGVQPVDMGFQNRGHMVSLVPEYRQSPVWKHEYTDENLYG